MFKKLVLAAAALAVSAPVLAGPHGKHSGKRFDRHGHREVVRHHHHYHPHRPVVVMPPPRVYYAPPPRVVYRPVYRAAPVYVAPPVYRSPVPYGGISIRFNLPF